MRRTLVVGIAVAAMAVLARTAHAQAPAPIGFDEAVAQALAKNPTVGQAATQIARAQSLLAQAHAIMLPSLSGTVTNTTLNQAFGSNGIVFQPQNQVALGVTASMSVFDLSRWSARDQASDLIGTATASHADVRRQIAVATAQAYLAIIAAKREVDVSQRALETARSHQDYAQKRFDGGAGTRLDAVRAAEEVSTDEAAIELSQLALERTQEALGVLITAPGPVDAGAEPAFAIPAVIDVDQAVAGRADIRLQAATIHAAERIVSDSWKDLMPVGTLSFVPQLVAPKGAFQPSKTWRLSLNVAFPIYSGGVQSAVKRERETSVDFAKLGLTSAEIQARADIRLAQAAVASSARVLASRRTAVDQANDVLRITTSAFEVGATTNIEVIDAQRSARDAETAAAVTEDALRQARLQLLVALGQFPK